MSTPFEIKPPRLKDLVNSYVMGEVWLRDSPFGTVTDSLTLAAKFNLQHSHVLRAIAKCQAELTQPKFNLSENLIPCEYLAGPKGKQRRIKSFEITEFGLALLLLYINSPRARQISAEILYRFFILKTYVAGLNERQIGAIRGYYRQHMKSQD